MLKRCKQPQAGYITSRPPTTSPDDRTLNAISLRLTGTVPFEQDYQSQVPDRGWGSADEGTRPSISISGGPGGDIPLSRVYGVPPSGGSSEAVIAETLVSQLARIPEDLQVYLGGILHDLAIGCFYLLLGQVRAHFPGSRRGAPSRKVLVMQATPTLLRFGDGVIFPITVDWRRWHQAIVPVLQDDRWHPLMPINSRRVLQERYPEFIALLEAALLQSYKDAGFLPQDL